MAPTFMFDEFSPLKSVALRHPCEAFKHHPPASNIWQELNWLDRPEFDAACEEYDNFIDLLKGYGTEIIMLPASSGLSPDALYVRDASLVTPAGIILCNMGKSARLAEPAIAARSYKKRGHGILGSIEAPGTIEGGDLIWIDNKTLVVGEGYRTNLSGIEQLKALLGKEIEVITLPLPHWNGPGDVFHLMSMISPLDRDLALIYPRPMPVSFIDWLRHRGITLLQVPDEEFDTMGCNVLALGPRKILALEGNPKTMSAMEKAGCEVKLYRGREISAKGCGGPTCLTRPLVRGYE